MKLIRSLIIIFLLAVHVNARAASDDFGWMNSSFDSITTFIAGCIEVPQFANIKKNSATLYLEESGEWVSAKTYVEADKLLQIEWSTKAILPSPAKYKVLYRIDPRFAKPQVFIQKRQLIKNADGVFQETYVSDFHQYKNGQLLKYQNNIHMTFLQRIQDFTDYFDFNGRSKIQVKKGDVVNITLDTTGNYFGGTSEMNSELGTNDELSLIYTESPMSNNRIIYSNSQRWCEDIITTSRPEYVTNCGIHTGKYWDIGDNSMTLEGRINNNAFNINKTYINACADGASGNNNNPICYYNKGRGMTLSVGGTTIKPITEKFITSSFTGKDFFYYKSDVDGDLDFTTDWDIDGMYNDSGQLNQFMENWGSAFGINNYATFKAASIALRANFVMNFLHFGRYLLDVEVGNSVATLPQSDLDAVIVEYIIMQGMNTPNNSSSGTSIDQNFRDNAPSSGNLWLRVIRPNDSMTGTIQIKTANYTGVTWFSDVVYKGLVKPLRSKFNELSEIIYTKLVTNVALQNIARSIMVIYIIVYGLMFLAGATQITVTDIVVRVLKIGVIVALFSETSWTFFSKNLFNVFVDGTDYLLTTVVGVTSNTGNIFGFVDPIIDKYTNSTIWGLLFIQLLQIHTGLTFFAIMTMYSILIYFRALLEVIVSYCLAFLGLDVMISIAPLFIILMLFERTKSIFDNWLSTLFSYMMQPTILLIFFLLIDQIISDQITQAVVESCWDILIPLKFGLDLKNLGIPISFSFTLPFLPGIPFYIPQLDVIGSLEDFFLKPGTFARVATSSLLFFAL
ncbi:MAG: type IV secretion system protein, partial [Rickettsiaceae bacterium]|nr:type IV secretion system protein [Rickettsiaceae bacterium]